MTKRRSQLALSVAALLLLAGCDSDQVETGAPSPVDETATQEASPDPPSTTTEASSEATENVRQRDQSAEAGSGDAVADIEAAMGVMQDELGLQCDGPTPADIPDSDSIMSIKAMAECTDGDRYALIVVSDEETDPDAYWEQEFLLAGVAGSIDEEAMSKGGSPDTMHSGVTYVGPYAVVGTYDDLDVVEDALRGLRD